MRRDFSRRLELLLLGILLLGGAGCSAFRAQIGFGLGFGTMVKVPAVLHAGNMVTWYYWRVGHDYDKGWTAESVRGHEDELAVVGLFHRDFSSKPHSESRRYWHWCIFVPVAFDRGEATWAWEIDLNLLAIQIKLGFNPWYWFHPPKSDSS